jgi:5-hydroxyisourate hydrolase-like protein (transthyretin family)
MLIGLNSNMNNNTTKSDPPTWEQVTTFATSSSGFTGEYEIMSLAADTYRVGFSFPGFPTKFYANAATLEKATNIEVGVGATVTGINVQLMTNGNITGHITDPTGTPVEGVRVAAYQYNPELVGWFSQAWTDTDSNGNYDLAGLAAGVYRIEFVDATFVRYMTEYYDNAAMVASAQDITVNAGASVSGIDAALIPLGHITGQVTDQKDNPLPDIQVTAYRYTPAMGGWVDYSFAVTDADGRYDLRGFEPGSYRVRFIDGTGHYMTEFYKNAQDINHARDIAVAQSEVVSGIDAKLKTVRDAKDGAAEDAAANTTTQVRFLYLSLVNR